MLSTETLFTPGQIVRSIEGGFTVRIEGELCDAASAVEAELHEGDHVLVAGDDPRYIVGILGRTGPRTIRVADHEKLRVLDSQGALLFEHGDGKTRVSAPRGDLELVAPSGVVRLHGAKGVSVSGPKFAADVRRIDVRAKRAHLRIEVLESVAKTVIAKATNVYSTVENVAQMLTGRLRLLVSGTAQINAEKTRIVSEKDTRIDGEHIHLG